MSKYYAVRVGRKPGVYTTWRECASQVNGYAGCIYKSFKTRIEAEKFMKINMGEPKTVSELKELVLSRKSKLLEIFIDGSHIKGSSTMGYGILMRYAGLEYGLSRSPVTPDQLTETFGGTFEKVSNPTMEFAALGHALDICNRLTIEISAIDITYDYIGSMNWLLGTWTCRKPYIKAIYEFALPKLVNLESRGIAINWKHVKSHTGHRENDMADMLAKGDWPDGLLDVLDSIDSGLL